MAEAHWAASFPFTTLGDSSSPDADSGPDFSAWQAISTAFSAVVPRCRLSMYCFSTPGLLEGLPNVPLFDAVSDLSLVLPLRVAYQ